MEPAPGTPQDFTAFIRSETERLKQVMHVAGIRAEHADVGSLLTRTPLRWGLSEALPGETDVGHHRLGGLVLALQVFREVAAAQVLGRKIVLREIVLPVPAFEDFRERLVPESDLSRSEPGGA